MRMSGGCSMMQLEKRFATANWMSRTAELRQELRWFREEIGDFQLALSRPYFTNKEKESPGEGGLLSITVNPYTCKGCMECVQVCDDDALLGPADRRVS